MRLKQIRSQTQALVENGQIKEILVKDFHYELLSLLVTARVIILNGNKEAHFIKIIWGH